MVFLLESARDENVSASAMLFVGRVDKSRLADYGVRAIDSYLARLTLPW